MTAGRPRRVDPRKLYFLAQELYGDFTRLAEGKTRLWFDHREYARLKAEPIGEPISFSPSEEARLQETVEQEILMGRTKVWQKADRTLALRRSESVWVRNYLAQDDAMRRIKVPGQLDVLQVLMSPNTTPDQIRETCEEALMSRRVTIGLETQEVTIPAWPIALGSVLPRYLSDYAEQFTAAKGHPRFPHCNISSRPTNQSKQFWFLARALAGAVFGVKTRTAINLVGATRPEQVFDYSRDAKSKRNRSKRQKKHS
jgi:hypothetical protein